MTLLIALVGVPVLAAGLVLGIAWSVARYITHGEQQ